MKKTPTIASGVAIAAGGMLAAALVTPTLSATADSDGGGGDSHERTSSSRAFAPYRCDGGKTKRVWNHGMGSGYVSIPSGSTKRLTANIGFRGPKRRRDTLTVTVSGVTHNHSASGDSRLEVTVNGRPMRPTEFGVDVPFSANTGAGGDEAHTMQFCREVNRGKKRVRVRFAAVGGDVHVESALVHAELSN